MVVEAVQQRLHVAGHEVEAGLVHQALLLGKVGGREYVLSVGFLDDELAAFEGFLGYFHEGEEITWGEMFREKLCGNRVAYSLG